MQSQRSPARRWPLAAAGARADLACALHTTHHTMWRLLSKIGTATGVVAVGGWLRWLAGLGCKVPLRLCMALCGRWLNYSYTVSLWLFLGLARCSKPMAQPATDRCAPPRLRRDRWGCGSPAAREVAGCVCVCVCMFDTAPAVPSRPTAATRGNAAHACTLPVMLHVCRRRGVQPHVAETTGGARGHRHAAHVDGGAHAQADGGQHRCGYHHTHVHG